MTDEIFAKDNTPENFPSQTRVRGTNEQEYQIYLACADDGQGMDITQPGQKLKTYEEWLGNEGA